MQVCIKTLRHFKAASGEYNVGRTECFHDARHSRIDFRPHRNNRARAELEWANSRIPAPNRHGHGPFCQLRIPAKLPYQGVYAIAVDGGIAYVGQCETRREKKRY